MDALMTIKKTPKKGKLVNTEHVNALVGNYKKERWIHNSQKLGKPDSLSTWYGLDELQSFLHLAKQHQADGIKMYYGVYGENVEADIELTGRQTIVLVATKQKKTQSGVVNKEIYVTRQGNPEILAFNFGSVCPPYCGTIDPNDSDNGFGIGFDMSAVGLSLVEKDGQIIIV